MPGLATSNFRLHNAEQFVEAFSEAANTSMYLYIGGTTPYTDGSEISSNYATPLNDTANVEYIPWRDLIAVKRIQSSDIANGIRRFDWATGTIYDMYDHTDNTLSSIDKKFQVITEEYNVYKCLSNNYGAASTSKPTGTGTSEVTYADGYIWKYMYTVSTSDALKFVTKDYIPVKTDSTISAASVDGAIHFIKKITGGSGYYQANTSISIVGDGTSATCSPIITDGALAGVTVSNKGSGYTFATAVITGVGVGATALPIISPKDGHGENAIKELYGTYVMINARLSGSESNTIPTTNDYRKLGLIRDPFLYGTTTKAYGSNYRTTYRYTIPSPTANYTVDEVVSATVDGVTTTAYVVEWDSTNKYLYTTKPVPKDITTAVTITGLTSAATGTANTVNNPGLQPYTGDIIYVENRGKITRTADQIEDIKLIIQF
jgi:hypothetical protein